METVMMVLLIVITVAVVIEAVVIINISNTEVDLSQQTKDYMKDESNRVIQQFIKEYSELKIQLQKTISESSKNNIKDLSEFKTSLQKDILEHFEGFNTKIERQMENINKKVEHRLSEGFDKTNKTFTNIVERLSRIDEAQKNIEKLSTDVVSLQHVLTDKKARGTFGEVQLNHILDSIFGENNQTVYETQATLPNGKIVDALLHIPSPMGDLAIDSKFPLENYQKMVDNDKTKRERLEATRKFKTDLKKHINDISIKYIIPPETSEQAVLFVPAEAIFAEINAYHQDIVNYAQKKRVWIASPTTLMSLLTTVQVLLRNVERDKHAKIIQEELTKLGDEFGRYKDRWNDLSKSIDTVGKRVKKIHITSDKIKKRFDEISQVQLEKQDEIDTQ